MTVFSLLPVGKLGKDRRGASQGLSFLGHLRHGSHRVGYGGGHGSGHRQRGRHWRVNCRVGSHWWWWRRRWRRTALDAQVPARRVPLIVIQLPPPLDRIGASLPIRRDAEASSTGGMVTISTDMVTVLVRQLGDRHLHKLRLVRVPCGDLAGHVDKHAAVALVGHGMVLGGPADTDLFTSTDAGHGAEPSTVGLGDGVLASFVGAGLAAVDTVGAGGEIARVLLVVAVGGRRVQVAEADARVDGELARPAVALAVAVGPACGKKRERCV